MAFLDKNFMLRTKTAERLFFEEAAELPIIDYHCHLQPRMIAEDYRFKNAYDLFLGGDHYKWRQMRSVGVDEAWITGDADDYEKWCKWAETLPLLIGNPLYHWTHLELSRYFDVNEPLSPKNCREVWDHCNKLLQTDGFTAKSLIKKSNVEVICTTDDPIDDLRYHEALADFGTRILPTFRPDKAVEIGKETFVPYMKDLGVTSLAALLQKLSDRIAFFHARGCRLSDHALETVPYATGDARVAFERRMAGETLTDLEIDAFRCTVLRHCAQEYAKRGWAMQLHIGALRNNNTRMYRALGPDTGFDSLADLPIAANLSAFLDSLDREDALPKTILYTLNPKDNYVLGTMLGNFQRGPIKSKLQFGSGWWFNDQRDGMEAQLRALGNLGALGCFVGMLTDSRSFVSYPRHEYFRRIFCNLIGDWVENGEYPDDREMLSRIVRGVSYENAKAYFDFPRMAPLP